MTSPHEHLRQLVAGRRVLLTASAASSPSLADQLRLAGAADIRRVPIDTSPGHSGVWETAVRIDGLLHRPGSELFAALSRDDPDGAAVVIAGSQGTAASVAGRPVLGYRRPEWAGLEYRDVQAQLTGGEGRILQVAEACALFRSGALAGPPSVVLRGLPRTSASLGSTHNFVVSMTDDPMVALGELAGDCDQVAVAPFAYGIPVTVYGFAAGRAVVMQSPVMALLFRDDVGRLHAPGILLGSVFSSAEIIAIEGDTARVANEAVSRVKFRGAFGVDGTLVRDRFVIHDFNARVCAGFCAMDRECFGIHPSLLDLVLRESEDAENILLGLGRRPIARKAPAAVLWDSSDARFNWIEGVPPPAVGRDAQTSWLAKHATRHQLTWAGTANA